MRDHDRDHGAEAENQGWLEQRQQPLELLLDARLERLGDLAEHRFDLPGLLADRHEIEGKARLDPKGLKR